MKGRLTPHGDDVLNRFKSKFDLPMDASIEQCVMAYLKYDEAKHSTLDSEEDRLLMRLAADDIKEVLEEEGLT